MLVLLGLCDDRATTAANNQSEQQDLVCSVSFFFLFFFFVINVFFRHYLMIKSEGSKHHLPRVLSQTFVTMWDTEFPGTILYCKSYTSGNLTAFVCEDRCVTISSAPIRCIQPCWYTWYYKSNLLSKFWSDEVDVNSLELSAFWNPAKAMSAI